jgi:hypothetical protein
VHSHFAKFKQLTIMPFVPAARVLCVVCNKTVYANEQVKLNDETFYHANCFKCNHCGKIVASSNYSQYNGVIYCKPHFLALFKQRGKYDDLAGDSAPKTSPQRSAPAEQKQEPAEVSSPGPSRKAGGKKDLNSVLRTRNAQAVQALIEKKGLGIIFKAGADGVSPLELAFSTNNSECGRVMLKAIEEALNTKQYDMEKPDDDKEDAAAAPAPVSKPAEPSPAPVEKPKPAPAPVASKPAPAPAPVAATPVPERHATRRSVAESKAELSNPIDHSESKSGADTIVIHGPVVPFNEAPAATSDVPSYLKTDNAKQWFESPMQSPEAQKVLQHLLKSQ